MARFNLDKGMAIQSGIDLFSHIWNRTTLGWNLHHEPLWCFAPLRSQAELNFFLIKETKPCLLKLWPGDIHKEIISSRKKWAERIWVDPSWTANEEAPLKKDRKRFCTTLKDSYVLFIPLRKETQWNSTIKLKKVVNVGTFLSDVFLNWTLTHSILS